MYTKIKSIRKKKNGTYSVCAKSSNTSGNYFTSQLAQDKEAAYILEMLHHGMWRLNKNKGNVKWIAACNAVNNLVNGTFDNHGITWEIENRYKLSDRDDGIRYICQAFGKYMETDDRNCMDIGKELSNRILTALDNIQKVKEEDRLLHRIRISCASQSIFEGYVLLFEAFPTGKGPLLAPRKDYSSGVLQTAPENIIWLGSDAEDLYSFLSFSGVNLTCEEYIALKPNEKDSIIEKYSRAKRIVDTLVNKGMKLNDTPFKGYILN